MVHVELQGPISTENNRAKFRVIVNNLSYGDICFDDFVGDNVPVMYVHPPTGQLFLDMIPYEILDPTPFTQVRLTPGTNFVDEGYTENIYNFLFRDLSGELQSYQARTELQAIASKTIYPCAYLDSHQAFASGDGIILNSELSDIFSLD